MPKSGKEHRLAAKKFQGEVGLRLYLSSFRIGNQPDALLSLLAGRKRTALILNADDYESPGDRAESLQRELEELSSIGLDPTEIDLRSYFGRSRDLQKVLAGFDLIYVRGGNVFILRRALRQSGADDIIRGMLEADTVVYAGYSAGPIMLGPSLRGIETDEDRPNIVPEGYEPEAIWDCLNILPFAIVPHHHSDWLNVGRAMDDLIAFYIQNHVPFIALRDGQAIVIDGDTQTVVG